jgi:hypothetical protein
MKWDTIWQILRYILVAAGTFLVSKGYFSAEQIEIVVGALGSIGAVLWGLYVKAGTTAVPDTVAARADVPTVSGATGSVSSGPGL